MKEVRAALICFFLFTILLISCNPGVKEETKTYSSAKTNSGKMLCASNLAYKISSGVTGPNVNEPWFSGAGFKTNVRVFEAGDNHIHSCILGKSDAGIVVAFRGTIPPSPLTAASLSDWFNNIFELPPMDDSLSYGKVHSGFKEAIDSLWPKFYPELKKMADSYPDTTKIYFTGHSKGGALAFIAGARYLKLHPNARVVITTFAAPKVGDAAFAERLEKKFIPLARWEAQSDIVPFLPPDFSFAVFLKNLPIYGETIGKVQNWQYTHAGTTKYLTSESTEVNNPISIFTNQTLEFIKILKDPKNGPEKLMKAHECGCGSIYQKGIAPELDCN